MSKTDFQNGFALGMASKGSVIQKTIHADSSVVSVIPPVYAPTVTAEIKSNIVADSSASLEE
jgi:hypothetical protein